jgi:hypothetical protein
MQLFQDEEPTKAQLKQAERRERYASLAAERLRAARGSQYSLMPFDELARLATNWYDACTDAMLRGNYGPVEDLVRAQGQQAAEQGFTLDDVFILLRQCRQVAIEKDGWHEDEFGEVDAAINQALDGLRHQVKWDISVGLDYLGREAQRPAEAVAARGGSAAEEAAQRERRVHTRTKLQMPIRINAVLPEGVLEEVTNTENVAKRGLYFFSAKPYYKGLKLQVMYPYWTTPGAINHAYPAEVVRVDARPDGTRGVAIRFTVGLGRGSYRLDL